eukprot:GHVO01041272.1.p2 GENE.GHVO01041272.1~~GHVO01041272.1.p2  ORF type:complete len:103 (-),score=11.29 GHVO01041272.1:8-316(-)
MMSAFSSRLSLYALLLKSRGRADANMALVLAVILVFKVMWFCLSGYSKYIIERPPCSRGLPGIVAAAIVIVAAPVVIVAAAIVIVIVAAAAVGLGMVEEAGL